MPARRARASTPETPDPLDAAIDALLRLASARSWAGIAMADIAAEAGLEPDALRRAAANKVALVAAFGRRIDAAMAVAPAEADASVRDKLFELVMRRFDALAPHRDAVRAIAAGLGRDPLGALCLVPGGMRAMAGLAEAAGISTRPPFGPLKIKALAAVYLGTFRVWLGDDSADAAKTMAFLDRALSRLEGLASSFPAFLNHSRSRKAA